MRQPGQCEDTWGWRHESGAGLQAAASGRSGTLLRASRPPRLVAPSAKCALLFSDPPRRMTLGGTQGPQEATVPITPGVLAPYVAHWASLPLFSLAAASAMSVGRCPSLPRAYACLAANVSCFFPEQRWASCSRTPICTMPNWASCRQGRWPTGHAALAPQGKFFLTRAP